MIARIVNDAASSLPALWRLARFKPNWRDEIDASANGFLRSFAGPVLALPFAMAAEATLTQSGGPGGNPVTIYWFAALAHALHVAAYPAAMAVVARLMGGGAGYTALIVTVNWAGFWLSILLAAVAMLQGAGLPESIVYAIGVALFSVGLYLTWRAARETLTGEISITILAVLLAFGTEVLGYAAADAVVRALW